MKRVLLLLAMAMVPVALFASEGAETNYDIVQRTVNFIIFAAILWYLLADKIKAFFANRTLGIQSELDKVQDSLKASKDRVAEAQKKLDDAKKISAEIIESAKSDIENIKQKVSTSIDTDIANLSKNLDEMIKVEISKAKKQVVAEILDELLNSENIKLSQDELVNIVKTSFGEKFCKGNNIDLHGINVKLLEEVGIRHIRISEICTKCSNEPYFSFFK